MPRWLRVMRGMIGTGITFGVGVGVAATLIAGVAWLAGQVTGLEVLQFVGKFGVVSFLLGVGFSGVLALAARGRRFNKLSYRLVSGMGAGAGVIYFALISLNGFKSWTPRAAVMNFVLLTAMGAGAAAATLLVARRSGAALSSGDVHYLDAGEPEVVRERSGSRVGDER